MCFNGKKKFAIAISIHYTNCQKDTLEHHQLHTTTPLHAHLSARRLSHRVTGDSWMERFQKLQMALKSEDASLVTWPAHAAGTLEALLMSGDERGHQDTTENYPKYPKTPQVTPASFWEPKEHPIPWYSFIHPNPPHGRVPARWLIVRVNGIWDSPK